jgi:hypothetical protein
VQAGSLYVADGVVVVSQITGTVADLMTALGAAVIQQCDYAGRRS